MPYSSVSGVCPSVSDCSQPAPCGVARGAGGAGAGGCQGQGDEGAGRPPPPPPRLLLLCSIYPPAPPSHLSCLLETEALGVDNLGQLHLHERVQTKRLTKLNGEAETAQVRIAPSPSPGACGTRRRCPAHACSPCGRNTAATLQHPCLRVGGGDDAGAGVEAAQEGLQRGALCWGEQGRGRQAAGT